MSNPVIQRLADAIGYPDALPDGTVVPLRADGREIFAEASPRGPLRLYHPLPAKPERLPDAAAWAAGRILRDDAVLAFGELPAGGDRRPALFLWKETADFSPPALLQFFETFLDSCDWWRARFDEGAEEAPAPEFPQMMIRP